MSIEPHSTVSESPITVGRYTILKRLAVGGMAELFLARADGIQGFEKLVAIKRILPQLARDQEMVGLFLDEARLAAHLHHPNVVQVFDVGISDGSYFIAMEYVHGQDLRAVAQAAHAQGDVLGYDEAVVIIASLAAGLHYAHERHDLEGRPLGIIHRDVSPSNVLVSYDGAVKLADFGIAKAAKRSKETQHGVVRGKVSYMSPEQCLNKPVDRRSDVFAVGILLYEISTGRRLFAGESDYEIMKQVLERPLPSPSWQRDDYPPELERMVERALARDPNDRYPTAQALQIELEEFARTKQLVVSQSRLASVVTSLFGKEQEAWRSAQDGGKDLGAHLTDTDVDVFRRTAPQLEVPPAIVRNETGARGTRRLDDAPKLAAPSRARRALTALSALVVVAAAALGTIVWRAQSKKVAPYIAPPAIVVTAPPVAAPVLTPPVAAPSAVAPPRDPPMVAAPVRTPPPLHATQAKRTSRSSRSAPIEAAPRVAPTASTAAARAFDPDAPLPPHKP